MNQIQLYLQVFFLNTIMANYLNVVVDQLEKLAGFKMTSLKLLNLKGSKAYQQIKKYSKDYRITTLGAKNDIFGEMSIFYDFTLDHIPTVNYAKFSLPNQILVIQFSSILMEE